MLGCVYPVRDNGSVYLSRSRLPKDGPVRASQTLTYWIFEKLGNFILDYG